MTLDTRVQDGFPEHGVPLVPMGPKICGLLQLVSYYINVVLTSSSCQRHKRFRATVPVAFETSLLYITLVCSTTDLDNDNRLPSVVHDAQTDKDRYHYRCKDDGGCTDDEC